MSDLISRSALMKDFEDLEAIALEQVNKYNPVYSRDEWRWWSAVLKERTAYKHDLMDAPVVDAVEMKHGEWQDVVENYFGDVYGTCPKCKESFVLRRGLANYCPNCGSRNIGIEVKSSERRENATD